MTITQYAPIRVRTYSRNASVLRDVHNTLGRPAACIHKTDCRSIICHTIVNSNKYCSGAAWSVDMVTLTVCLTFQSSCHREHGKTKYDGVF